MQTGDNLEQFGRYVTAWVAGWEQTYGVPLYAISIQNEMTFENPFDSCSYLHDENGHADQWWQYTSALRAVRNEIRDKGVKVKLMGPHIAKIGPTSDNPWALRWQVKYIEDLKKPENADVYADLDIINSNGYQGQGETVVRGLAAYWLGADKVTADWGWYVNDVEQEVTGIKNDGKPVWFSENGGDRLSWPGPLNLSLRMFDSLVHADVTAYLHWLTSLNTTSTLSYEEEGHVLFRNNDLDDPHQSKKYCAYKQFTRYIRPGSRRVSATFSNGAASIGGSNQYDTVNSINVTAFIHDRDRTTAIVFVNMTDHAETVTVNVPALPAVTKFQVFRTSNVDNFASQPDLNLQNGSVSLDIPAESIVTLYGKGPLVAGDPDGDQIDTLFELYFGSDPYIANHQIHQLQLLTDGNVWTVKFPRAKDVQEVYAALEWSTDLLNWQSDGFSTPSVIEDLGDIEMLSSEINDSGDETLFIRLNADVVE